MTATAGLILDQVLGLIEPLTRFDRSALRLCDESEQTLRCTGNWIASVAISSSVSDGSGNLPSGVRNASSESGMERAINDVVSTERSHIAQRIRSWCDTQAGIPPSNHKPLDSDNCISGITRIGYTWKCSACEGRGKSTCSGCSGNGKVTCSYCHGKGRMKCSQCQGKGMTTCRNCGGSGNVSRQVEKRGYNTVTQQSFPIYETVWENCSACRSGQTICVVCHGGTVACSCNGAGKVTCNACQGRGAQTCKSCKGSGTLHRIAETTCQVTNSFTIESSDFDAEAQQTMAGWDFPLFCQLASVTGQAPSVTDSQLNRSYPAKLSLTQARIQCAGQDLLLNGYGSKARVFDFKGIVGNLLAGDLQQLRSTLQHSRRFFPFRNQDALRTSLSAMLESELNQQLANPQQRAKLIANRTVTEEHAATTVDCLRKAMSRLYGPIASIGIAALFVVALFTLYKLLWTGYMLPQNRAIAVIIFLVVMVVTAIVAEFLSRHFLLKAFSRAGKAEGRQAANRLLCATGTLRRWRIAAALTIGFAIIGFFTYYAALL